VAKVTSTGIPALDSAMMKGVPRGFTILVTGDPGTALELFAKQFAGANQDTENVVFFTTGERDQELMAAMEAFGFKTDMRVVNMGEQYYQTVLAQQLEISRYRQEGLTLKDVRKFESEARGQRRATDFLSYLTYEFAKMEAPFRAVIDSLDFFLDYYPHTSVLSVLRTIKSYTQHAESVCLVTMLNRRHDAVTQSGVEEIVDIVIELERVRDGNAFRRNLLLRKVRNHPQLTGIYNYEITKDGITPSPGAPG